MLLPAPHVRVGNGWWNNRFRQVILPPVKQKSMRLSGRTAEAPLVTLLGLAHLGIAGAIPVLGGRWGSDDCGVNDRAFL